MAAVTKAGIPEEQQSGQSAFRSKKVLLEELPQLAGISIRVELHVSMVQRAVSSEPESDTPEHKKWKQDNKSYVAILEDDFPAMVLLMETGSEIAATGLGLLAKYGSDMEVRLAAGLCLERINPRSQEASSASLSAQGPSAP